VAGPAGKGGFGESGYKTYLKGARGKVLVPGKCWKVILILPEGVTDPKKATAEAARVIAVIMPNIQGLDPDWRAYSVSVKDVEDLTGYTFFGELPPDVAKALKAENKDAKAKPEKKPDTEKNPGAGPGKDPKEPPATGGKGVVLPAFKEGCVIGNSKSKKYHVPGGGSYNTMKTSKNAVFFATAEDAKKAGYTQAAR
jgi:hypothetical protein